MSSEPQKKIKNIVPNFRKSVEYPNFIDSQGSKCYFSFGNDFFENNKLKATEMITFYTLFLFGHQKSDDQVLILSKTQFNIKPLQFCMNMLFEDKLKHKIFHVEDKNDKKLFNLYSGHFVTKQMLQRDDLSFLKIKNENVETYSSMYVTGDVQVFSGTHVLEDSSDDEMLIDKRMTEYEYNCEPHCDEADCYFCDKADEIIDKTTFALKKRNHVNNKELLEDCKTGIKKKSG